MQNSSELKESCLYSFLDNESGYLIYFLEGQKLISDLAILQEAQSQQFGWYRYSVLSVQLMISFLKDKEGFGFYLDSEVPYFKLKIETGYHGQMRSLVIPENFEGNPKSLTGKCRFSKVFYDKRSQPYTSIIDLHRASFQEIVNQVLAQSFQMDSIIMVSGKSDQSLMISKLPDDKFSSPSNRDLQSAKEYLEKHRDILEKIMATGSMDRDYFEESFEKMGFKYLGSKPVFFKCTCSQKQMEIGIKSVIASGELIYADGETEIETKCDYCKTRYVIRKEDVE